MSMRKFSLNRRFLIDIFHLRRTEFLRSFGRRVNYFREIERF